MNPIYYDSEGRQITSKDHRDPGTEVTVRAKIMRDLEPHIKYIRRIGHSLTAKNIEKVVRGEME